MTLSVLPLGVGDAFSRRFYSSCLLVQAESTRVLVDCPHPLRKMLLEAQTPEDSKNPLDLGDIDAVVLTHLHADHCSGLESVGYFFRFVLGRKLPIYAHPEVSCRLWAGSLAAGMEQLYDANGVRQQMALDDYFELRPLSLHVATVIGPLTIHSRFTQHHVPTTAVRFETTAASVGYSADSRFDPSLIAWLDRADLIIHETNLGPSHTPYAKLLELSDALKRKMRLIHYPDEFSLAKSQIEPARQGVWLEIEQKGE
jgi:ribonuclease BN (tRNA processing enzyme)